MTEPQNIGSWSDARPYLSNTIGLPTVPLDATVIWAFEPYQISPALNKHKSPADKAAPAPFPEPVNVAKDVLGDVPLFESLPAFDQ